jgi:hypothetical protein
LSPRGARRRNEAQQQQQQQTQPPPKAEPASLLDWAKEKRNEYRRSRAYALAASDSTGWKEIREREKEREELKEKERESGAATKRGGGAGGGHVLASGEVMEAIRREEEERARRLEFFFDSMERTYVEERERRERAREDARLAQLERDFADLRTRLREAIAANARHAHELAEREKRVEHLQTQLRLAQRRVHALERDEDHLSSSSSSSSTGASQWRHGRHDPLSPLFFLLF